MTSTIVFAHMDAETPPQHQAFWVQDDGNEGGGYKVLPITGGMWTVFDGRRFHGMCPPPIHNAKYPWYGLAFVKKNATPGKVRAHVWRLHGLTMLPQPFPNVVTEADFRKRLSLQGYMLCTSDSCVNSSVSTSVNSSVTSSATTSSVTSSNATTSSVSSSVSRSVSSSVSGQHSNARTLCGLPVITLRGRLCIKKLPLCNSLGVDNASCLSRAVLAVSGGLQATPRCDVNIESMRGAVRQHVALYDGFFRSVCGHTWLHHTGEEVVAAEYTDECLQVNACSVIVCKCL